MIEDIAKVRGPWGGALAWTHEMLVILNRDAYHPTMGASLEERFLPGDTRRLLSALAEQLETLGESLDLVIIGGAGLQALGIIQRPTRDVDVLGLRKGDELLPLDAVSNALRDAAAKVARDLGVHDGWLDTGAAALMERGLPAGFVGRLHTERIDPNLVVHLASRSDQIHLKLIAMVDTGHPRHEQDIRSLAPTAEELAEAATWIRRTYPSPNVAEELDRVVRHLVGDGP